MLIEADARIPRLAEAEVVAADADGLVVLLPDGRQRTVMPAFTVPYRPVPGDRLLVIGDAAATYAIGVVAGAGQLTLSTAGDITLHAQDGRLTLSGDAGVEIVSPAVTVVTPALEVVAERLTELLGTALRRVRGLFSLEAGRSTTFVEGHSSHHSETALIAASETVTVSGTQVHLG